jgi:hypothetical protein
LRKGPASFDHFYEFTGSTVVLVFDPYLEIDLQAAWEAAETLFVEVHELLLKER